MEEIFEKLKVDIGLEERRQSIVVGNNQGFVKMSVTER